LPERTIELKRTIDAPPPTVFRALTDAAELSRWWTSSAESDARTGGSFSYGFEFDDASRNHTYTGAYHEIVTNERVSYPWQGALGETRVDVSLRPAGDGTELTLAHSGWGEGDAWDEAVAMHEQGWGFFLDNLKAYLERGADARASAMGMKTPAAV
jgi:uncharacterized protein YndB with AHSA1/START domain